MSKHTTDRVTSSTPFTTLSITLGLGYAPHIRNLVYHSLTPYPASRASNPWLGLRGYNLLHPGSSMHMDSMGTATTTIPFYLEIRKWIYRQLSTCGVALLRDT